MAERFSVLQTTPHDGDAAIGPGETVATSVTITNQSTTTDATGAATHATGAVTDKTFLDLTTGTPS